jgi:hypothetical protein
MVLPGYSIVSIQALLTPMYPIKLFHQYRVRRSNSMEWTTVICKVDGTAAGARGGKGSGMDPCRLVSCTLHHLPRHAHAMWSAKDAPQVSFDLPLGQNSYSNVHRRSFRTDVCKERCGDLLMYTRLVHVQGPEMIWKVGRCSPSTFSRYL